MAEPPAIEELARRYMDLWEEQLAAVAGDRVLADQMGRLFEAMKQGAGFPAGGDAVAGRTDEATDGEPTGPAPGATAAGAASERGDGDMAEFARRLAAVEERLIALESKLARKSTKAAPGHGAKRGG